MNTIIVQETTAIAEDRLAITQRDRGIIAIAAVRLVITAIAAVRLVITAIAASALVKTAQLVLWLVTVAC